MVNQQADERDERDRDRCDREEHVQLGRQLSHRLSLLGMDHRVFCSAQCGAFINPMLLLTGYRSLVTDFLSLDLEPFLIPTLSAANHVEYRLKTLL